MLSIAAKCPPAEKPSIPSAAGSGIAVTVNWRPRVLSGKVTRSKKPSNPKMSEVKAKSSTAKVELAAGFAKYSTRVYVSSPSPSPARKSKMTFAAGSPAPRLNVVIDRNSAIAADGWRCLVSSVVASDGPPSRRH